MSVKTGKVILNKEEAGWFSRNVVKTIQLLEASESKNPGVRDRSIYKGMSSMKSRAEQMADALKAFGDEPFEIDIILSVKQRKLIADLVGSQVRILKEKTIPLYESRGSSHAEYLFNARLKCEMLAKMRKKFT